jgi:multiple sugar transport system permease protein
MPIISKVEAQTTRGRIVQGIILTVLTIGGLTMLYPFAIMVSGALRSEMDEADLDLVPGYMHDRQMLIRKFLETKYDQNIALLNRSHGRQNFSFRQAAVVDEVSTRQVEDLQAFLEQTDIPRHWQTLGGAEGIRTVPENLRRLREELRERFDDDLPAFSRDMGSPVAAWNLITFRSPDWLSQRYDYEDNALHQEYFALLDEATWAHRPLVSISGFFVETMLLPVYGREGVPAYNKAHAVPIDSYERFVLPPRVPGADQPKLREEWIEFVQKELNPAFVGLADIPDQPWQAYLSAKYGSIDELNQTWGTEFKSFQDIPLGHGMWRSGARRNDYQAFLAEQPVERYVLIGPEYAYREWLREEYRDVAALNAAHGTRYRAMDQAWVPQDQLETAYVQDRAGRLRWTYATRNFINVADALFVHGRAFLNTIIFCSMAICVALLINPLAGYALSRFQLPGTYKFLLFLMATMSFPPMVTMIPTFIMLRELSLLNTFLALILPSAANGYMIFLLKGFFDSLPRDLYDAATIDGASEVRMFFQITMALSKPILAVIALGAFNHAYLMFLYALIVCPDQDMWLLSVWMFQYQQTASMSGVFASVLIASVPPLLIFVFAQNVIMRGIVVPVEK